MSDIAVRVEGLGKRYRLGQQVGYKTLRETVLVAYHTPTRVLAQTVRRLRQPQTAIQPSTGPSSDYIWALKDVSFEVKHSQAIGIIGRNGSGKSTLLKILSRITAPTEGRAEIRGRIGSLLEVGTGFHPELTGRENIYLNGAIIGMKKAEIDRKFSDIVEFAEIEKFLDTPVKRYSSGMYVRLAFAVAAHLDPEILVVDEVLAVGDAAFQKKCLGKMGDVTKEGRTVLFVSHSMATIESLCAETCLLEQGHLVGFGPTQAIIEQYMSALQSLNVQPLAQRRDRRGDAKMRFTDIAFHVQGTPAASVRCGDDVTVLLSYETGGEHLPHVAVSIAICTLANQCMMVLSNQMAVADFDSVPPVGKLSCTIRRFPLAPGQYYVNLHCEVGGGLADWVQQAAYLTVEPADFYGTGRLPPQTHGGMLVPQDWRVESGMRG